jgi:hypothetical protein
MLQSGEPMNHKIGLITLTASAVLGSAYADVISYPDFSSVSGLTLNGNASQQGNSLQLTPANINQSGSAFSTTTVALNNLSSFSTRFQFQITSSGGIGDEDGIGADGIVFAVQTVANNVGGAGGGIGYLGINPSVGIEFDTYNNGEVDGGNHAGIDLNGSVNSLTSVHEGTRFNDGNIWTAWVDYNGNTGDLEVRYNQSGVRPASANLSYNLNLAADLGTPNAYVGFTAGTGSGYGDQRILNWQFVSDYAPIGAVPDGGSSGLYWDLRPCSCSDALKRAALKRIPPGTLSPEFAMGRSYSVPSRPDHRPHRQKASSSRSD